MTFLHEKIDVLRESGFTSDMPLYISEREYPKVCVNLQTDVR